MPRTEVVFFKDHENSVPVLDWLDGLPRKIQNKCYVKVERLEELGHELRRPEADFLEQGIYELRIGYRGVNYRVLYAFHEKEAVLLHGLVKEKVVRETDLNIAISRLNVFRNDPKSHTYSEMAAD
jgi:phage-related protein